MSSRNTQKKDLRGFLKHIRSSQMKYTLAALSVIQNLEKWLEGKDFQSLGFYLPLPGEVDLTDTIAKWLSQSPDRVASVPHIEEGEMKFSVWTPDSDLEESIFNTRVPKIKNFIEPEVLLVACVGFDENNYRLGYGGGWYDRYLGSRTDDTRPYTVGIALEACRVQTVFADPTDIPLDLFITN